MIKEVECSIIGRVQMVMFRDFVQRKARSLGIVGTVQNLQDGSVHIVAQGEEEDLNKLIKLLDKGPVLSKVENIKVDWKEVKERFSDFNIIF